jgi:tRNA 2-thiouridine synthesizing protein C
MVKKILLVIKNPPYGSGRAAEGLRVATAMIAMDVLPEILFIDDGVYCLLKNQKPETAGLKSFGDRLKTLSDLVGLKASSDSLSQRHLEQADISEDYEFKALAPREIADLFSQNEAVITF